MTDKERIKCKYKFQDKEKFDGKPYCICFNELCEDLSFVCDHNCQIYEDYKQLARKTQENDRYRKALDEIEIELTKYQAFILGKPITQRENDCLYKILDIINKVKEQ